MKTAIVVLGLSLVAGCVRVTEGAVRDQAASDFACADYALTVVEIGPDVYRATGCGQELIYACRSERPSAQHEPDDISDRAVMVCARSTDE